MGWQSSPGKGGMQQLDPQLCCAQSPMWHCPPPGGRGPGTRRFSSDGGWCMRAQVPAASSLAFIHLILMTFQTPSSLGGKFGELSLQNLSEARPLRAQQREPPLPSSWPLSLKMLASEGLICPRHSCYITGALTEAGSPCLRSGTLCAQESPC